MGCGGSKSVEVKPTEPPHKRKKSVKDHSEIHVKRDEENGEHLSTKQSNMQGENHIAVNSNAQNKNEENSQNTSASTDKNQTPRAQNETDTKFHLSSIYSIIKQGVYVNDLTELTQQKTQNLTLEDQLRDARSKLENPPPINEKEEKSDNPRRVMPPRNYGREQAWVLAVEIDIIFDIYKKSKYDKNMELLSKLQEEHRNIEKRLHEVIALEGD